MKTKLPLSLGSSFIFFLLAIVHLSAGAQTENQDPDLPSFSKNIDKQSFMLNRQAYIDNLRGSDLILPYNARLSAIAQKKQWK